MLLNANFRFDTAERRQKSGEKYHYSTYCFHNLSLVTLDMLKFQITCFFFPFALKGCTCKRVGFMALDFCFFDVFIGLGKLLPPSVADSFMTGMNCIRYIYAQA